MQLAHAGAVRAGGELLQRGEGALVLPAAVGGLGGVPQQLRTLRPVVRGQGEGQRPVAVRLREAVQALGGTGGRDDRRQRADRLAGLLPVVRQPGMVRLARDGVDGLGVAAVPRGVLGGQDLVLEHLGDHPVPQPVAVRCAGHEPVRDRGPDRLDQLRLGQRQHPRQQGVLDRLDARGHRVHHVVGVLRQLVDPGQEDLAQRVGQLHPAVAQVPGELLGHERVAAAALEDPVRVLGRDVVAGDRADQLGGRVLVERGQVDDAYGPQPAQLRQDPPQRVGAVQGLGADRGQHRQADLAEAREQVEQHLPGAAVGPLEVVEDQQQPAAPGQRSQLPGDPFEQGAGAVLGGVGRAGTGLDAGVAQGLQHRVQRGGVADVEARAVEHGGAGRPHRVRGLPQQAALADAALPGDEHRGGAAGTGGEQVGLDRRQDVGTPGKRRLIHLAGHAWQPSGNSAMPFSSVRTVLRHK
ncbi:hypothetical protein Asp14428_69660 [Actinoplanes sp. NBRC 14428]|nr:hypothetical protein Asp14428_69660 [Actinoplanes sp. NBRC 14428]